MIEASDRREAKTVGDGETDDPPPTDEEATSRAEEEEARKNEKNNVSAGKPKDKKNKIFGEARRDSTRLEESPAQVTQRFRRGCECQDDRCFDGLNPEAVYRHRLNIAELTKAEHDMYLMGVTMACLTDPRQTARNTQRRRLRAQYVYQGRRVCLDAFLYLENCTHYQIKRIRKHLVTHGVAPRVHGNHGKIPHNTFSLDIYQIATDFLKNFLQRQERRQRTKSGKNTPLHLTPEITRKNVYDEYLEYCRQLSPEVKTVGYSTFRRFMKVQFPQIKFAKLEFVARHQQRSDAHVNGKTERGKRGKEESPRESAQFVTENAHRLVPMVVASTDGRSDDTFFIASVDKLRRYRFVEDGLLVDKTGRPLTLDDIPSA